MDSCDHRNYYGPSWSPRRSSYLGKVTRVADQMGEKGGEAMLFRHIPLRISTKTSRMRWK